MPEPDGPMSARNSPLRDVEVEPLQDVDLLAAAAEDLVHAANADQGFHESCSVSIRCLNALLDSLSPRSTTRLPLGELGRTVRHHAFARREPGHALRPGRGRRRPTDRHRAALERRSGRTTNTNSAPSPPSHRASRDDARPGARPRGSLAPSAPGSAEKRDLDAHVGKDARVELVEGDAHLHGRLLPVGGRDGGDHVRRDLPVGVGVERRLDRLARSRRAGCRPR